MGCITNEFTCVEFQIDPDYNLEYDEAVKKAGKRLEVLKIMVEACRFKDYFNLVEGSNGNIYFTAAPCGSKDGWETKKAYEYEVELVCNAVKAVADFHIIKKVTTSEG